MILGQKKNVVLDFNFFLRFRNLDSIFHLFKQNMSFIADAFLNLRTPKNMVR